MDALVAPALGVVVSRSALLGVALGVGPSAVAVAVGVGPAVVGVVGVELDPLDAGWVGMAVGEELADGDGTVPSRTGDGTGRGLVPVVPAGPTGTAGTTV